VVLVARDQQKGMVVAIRVHAARGDLSTIGNGVGVNAASDGTFKKITSSMRIPANRKTIAAISTKVTIRMGMSGSENCGLAAPEHVDTAAMDSTAATQPISLTVSPAFMAIFYGALGIVDAIRRGC